MRLALAMAFGMAFLAGGVDAQVPLGTSLEARHMVGHRAAYRLTLDRARDNSDVAQASGAMLFEVLDACDGWTVRQRLTLKLMDRDGNETETVSDYSTYETLDGTRLRFSLTQSSQGAVASQVQGEGEVAASGGVVRFAQPQGREISLPPGTLLPMAHTLAALNAARAGNRILAAPLLDGTTASGAQDTTTVMSPWQATVTVDPRFAALAPLGSSRMRIAFFDRDPGSQSGGAGTPDYEVSLRYFENGVADELKMDFGEFVVDGRLMELVVLPSPC